LDILGHNTSFFFTTGIIQGWDRRLFELRFAEKKIFEQKLENKWTCLIGGLDLSVGWADKKPKSFFPALGSLWASYSGY
jgi:hypothetical protein